jgi:hypothetical protein
MSLKKYIFDSSQEERIFAHLKTIWKDKFNIYPQLPFTKIFDIETLTISRKEKDFLLKTNIDYTICNKKEKPLMCIEFDGLSGGYNKGGEYIQIKEDQLRKKKLELKLKIAMQEGFPFYIISYPEKKYLSEGIHLTVIDGIIGQTIAKTEFQGKINECLKDSQSILDSMNEYERHEYIEHIGELLTILEVELECTWDPIAKKAAEIRYMLSAKEISMSERWTPLSKLEFPEIKDIFNVEVLEKRLKLRERIKWLGYEVSCETPKGKVTKQAWIRNFEGMQASPSAIVQNIAELLALYKAAILNGIEI